MYSSARSWDSVLGSGTASATPTTISGFVPQVTIGLIAPASTTTVLLVRGAVVRPQRPPLVWDRIRRTRATDHPLERRLVGRDHARAAAALDRHVADRHPAFHAQRLNRRTRVLDDVPDGALDAHLADRRQDQVLGGDAEPERSVIPDQHRLRLALHEALGREHVFDLARPDPERERTERAVRRGMRVAAHDRHPRLRDSQFGADHVDDSLVLGAERVDRDLELRAVALERLHLHA